MYLLSCHFLLITSYCSNTYGSRWSHVGSIQDSNKECNRISFVLHTSHCNQWHRMLLLT